MNDESFEQNFSWSEWTFVAPDDAPAPTATPEETARRVVERSDSERKWTA